MTHALPFSVSKTSHFFDELNDYISDVFYEILPEHGYELRDEQIYMAYQLEQAFKNKSVIFAEAGVGTGKTFVYLLYAICYARYMGKPAIISCADETLIEQLVKTGGDLEKLEKALGLDIDVRLAKAREQYVCVKKLDHLSVITDDEGIQRVHDDVPAFVFDSTSSMSSFEKYGDRKDYPWLTDSKWESIAWDPLQHCSTCDFRHRCGQTLHRKFYRETTDLIICSHDFYMEHIWTKESRQREGQLPLLPEASCVIFDEGHLLEFAAQKGLTYRFHAETLSSILTGYMGQDVREETLYLVEHLLDLHEAWFDQLSQMAVKVEGSHRKEVTRSSELLQLTEKMNQLVQELLEQLVFDTELHALEDYHAKIIEEYLEFFSYGLAILLKDNEGIFWLEETESETTFVIMPRLVEDILRKEVFSQPIPFIFSSATLSKAGDFTHFAQSLGIETYTSMTVDSPFNYDEQMELIGHIQMEEQLKWEGMGEALRQASGKTLILFSTSEEMARFREWADGQKWSFDLIYEGDREISETVKRFQQEETTVLASYHLWEGLDVPGKALSQVILSSLPFPPKDPVFQAKRQHAKQPLEEVDVPYMLLRLRQGIGRLIRSREDHGTVQIWMTMEQKRHFMNDIDKILPVKIMWD